MIKTMDYSTVSIDLKNICLICLRKTDNNNTDIFADCDESKDILSKIFTNFQITFTYVKLKPSVICAQCINEINNINDFRIKCLTIDERFNNYCKQFLERNSCKDEIISVTTDSDNIDAGLLFINSDSNNADTHFQENSVQNKSNLNIATNSFKCTLCNKVLKTMTSLLKHNVSMHENRKHVGRVSGYGAARRYHCIACAYSTPHSQTLVNHMRRHNGERPYSCECGKAFTQASSLAAHRKTHSNTTFFTCTLCGKQFKHAFAMKNHLRVHESGSYTCNICTKSLKSKQTLDAHMRRHYNIHNYNCEDCGDTFVTSAELLNHRKKHSVHKKVECHLCGYKTHTKKNLIVHLKRHAGNRTFKCDTCKVAFYTRSNLLRHRRVHTREKPFSCPACAQRYKYSPSLNKHMKTVHGVHYKWADFKWKEDKITKLTVKEEMSTIL